MGLKNENITTILNLSTSTSSNENILETLVDNVVLIDINSKGDELERKITVFKSRMNITKSKWFKFTLDSNGRPLIK